MYYLISHLALHVARWKGVCRQAEVFVHSPIDARRCSGASAQNASHLGQFSVA